MLNSVVAHPGDLMPTLDQLQSLLTADPTDAFLLYAVAMELTKLGRSEDAVAAFADLRNKHPDYIPAYFMGARAFEQNGDIEDAKELLRTGISLATAKGDTHAASEMSAALTAIE